MFPSLMVRFESHFRQLIQEGLGNSIPATEFVACCSIVDTFRDLVAGAMLRIGDRVVVPETTLRIPAQDRLRQVPIRR